jgi:predicted unusual protein kinase regulating ubiquinone biosynthesis (AarF/ABC1/UbiB family)
MPDDKDVPTSRAARTAIIGKMAAGQVARHAGTKVAVIGRSDERKKVVMDRRQAEAIRALVDALGLMRGAAMKVGQMLSMIDIGLVPPEMREELQQGLAKLRDSAPTVNFAQMRAVIEGDLGAKLATVFSDFDETPLAAASIGQVYRARLHDGRDVAVKVQYPGVDKAVRADLKNLGMIMRAVKLMAPGLDISALTDEIRERIGEELDYELEAQNQRAAARLYRDHPFIVVPDVITTYCGPHVLVTDFFDGARFDDIVAGDQATRDRVGEIVFRFFAGSLYQHRQFSPDPHPGNFLMGTDGRMAFLDFGLYRHMDEANLRTQKEILRKVCENDAEGLLSAMQSGGFIRDLSRATPERTLAYVREVFWWMATDDEVTMFPDIASEAMIQTVNPTSDYFAEARQQSMPADYVFVLRMVVMVMAALGELGATANWHRIAREWLYDDEPATELGRLDAAYRAGGPARIAR